jgi:hypothetical protein
LVSKKIPPNVDPAPRGKPSKSQKVYIMNPKHGKPKQGKRNPEKRERNRSNDTSGASRKVGPKKTQENNEYIDSSAISHEIPEKISPIRNANVLARKKSSPSKNYDAVMLILEDAEDTNSDFPKKDQIKNSSVATPFFEKDTTNFVATIANNTDNNCPNSHPSEKTPVHSSGGPRSKAHLESMTFNKISINTQALDLAKSIPQRNSSTGLIRIPSDKYQNSEGEKSSTKSPRSKSAHKMNNSSSVGENPESGFRGGSREKNGVSDAEGGGGGCGEEALKMSEKVIDIENLKKIDRKLSRITLTKPDEYPEQAVTLVSQNSKNKMIEKIIEAGEVEIGSTGTPVANLPPKSPGLQGEGSWLGFNFETKSKESPPIDLPSTPEKNIMLENPDIISQKNTLHLDRVKLTIGSQNVSGFLGISPIHKDSEASDLMQYSGMFEPKKSADESPSKPRIKIYEDIIDPMTLEFS